MIDSGTASQPKTSTRRRLALDILLTLGLLAMIACVALAFIFPWLPAFPPGGLTLARYAPIADGDAWLGEQVTSATSAKVFRSENMRILAPDRAMTTELRQAAIDELHKYVLKPGETSLDNNQFLSRISAMQIILEEDQNLSADGALQRNTTVLLRTPSGDYQISAYYPAQNTDLVFDPPVLLYPANLLPGAQWQGDGSLGVYQYHSSGSIAAETSYQGDAGSFTDCRKTSLRLTIKQQSQVAADTTYVDWFCSGIGQVDAQEQDPSGKILNHTWLLSSSRQSGAAAQRKPLPVMPGLSLLDPATQAASPLPDPANWVLNVIGRTRTAADTTDSTVQPVWTPTNPPMLLVAGHAGDLLALDITAAPGKILWRYHPGGTIFGQPAFDAVHQQIYFGDSGKQLVALDLHGLFRWSFACGDNIVTRPVVIGDRLVFGSEDRNVYALDARSGALLWKYTTGGAVAASPVVVAGTVMIGSDDGVVYAFDGASGKKVWSFTTGQAVEAPLVAAGGVVYIASRDMNLYAVSAASGQQVWVTQIGNLLRTQPAPGKDALYLVDENGHLSAVSMADGRLLWTSVERDYEGAPLLFGQTLLAAANNGLIYRLSTGGKRLSSVSGSVAYPAFRDLEFDYRLGLAQGGGSAWAVDTKGYIWRFGPAWGAAQPLALNWTVDLDTSPFNLSAFYAPPQVWQSHFIVTNQTGHVYQIDPATGQARLLGSLKDQPGNFRTGLALAGETLLGGSSNVLYAAHLPDLKPLWQFQANGFGLMPPTVEGESVAWVTGGSNNQASLNLLDLKSGKVAWEARLDGVAFPGNAIIRNGLVYINSPVSAFRLENGQKVWQAANANSLGIGLAVLSPDGATLYTALTNAQNLQNRVAAISTRDGSLLWLADLGTDGISLIGTLDLEEGFLILPLNNGTRSILAIDPASGKQIWRYTPDSPRLGNPFINKGLIWITQENGQVVTVDLKTGSEVARLGLTQADLEGYDFVQSIAISGAYALAPTGWSLLEIKIPAGLSR